MTTARIVLFVVLSLALSWVLCKAAAIGDAGRAPEAPEDMR